MWFLSCLVSQDNYLEEALKIRNLLQEFHQHQGCGPPTIIGLREHIFTERLDSLGSYVTHTMSLSVVNTI